MPTLTLADLRNMQPAGATSEHMAHAAWLATDDASSMLACIDAAPSLYRWADEHPSMGTLRVTYTYPDECPKIGQYESL